MVEGVRSYEELEYPYGQVPRQTPLTQTVLFEVLPIEAPAAGKPAASMHKSSSSRRIGR